MPRKAWTVFIAYLVSSVFIFLLIRFIFFHVIYSFNVNGSITFYYLSFSYCFPEGLA